MQLRLVCGAVGLVALGAFYNSRQDAPELQHAEETVTAGVAAIGGKSQPALQKNEGSGLHALPGDVFEVEVPAAGTMRVAFQTGGYAPSVESPVAPVTSPGPQTRETG